MTFNQLPSVSKLVNIHPTCLSRNHPRDCLLGHQLPVVGGGRALVELEAADVEAGDLVVVVGELLFD